MGVFVVSLLAALSFAAGAADTEGLIQRCAKAAGPEAQVRERIRALSEEYRAGIGAALAQARGLPPLTLAVTRDGRPTVLGLFARGRVLGFLGPVPLRPGCRVVARETDARKAALGWTAIGYLQSRLRVDELGNGRIAAELERHQVSYDACKAAPIKEASLDALAFARVIALSQGQLPDADLFVPLAGDSFRELFKAENKGLLRCD